MTAASDASARSETHHFQAEVSQVLRMVIDSLYSHREIFLRELISNASDALDQRRVRELTEPDLVDAEAPYAIRVWTDRDAKTVHVEDFGVGMDHDDLVSNLGTVARSGTRRFLEALREQQQGADETSLIGQFGVGFYSAFLVADRVDVETRPLGGDQAWRWSSDAKETFTVEPGDRSSRGTKVVLHLDEEHEEFLEPFRLRELIERYSDYIRHPIELLVERQEQPDEPQEGEQPEPQVRREFEQVNQGTAIWQRPQSELSRDDYAQFYKHLTRDWEDPLTWNHFHAEGLRSFTGLLYLPKQPPFDLFAPEMRHGIRLYVKRVFVMDDCDDVLPRWLRFVRGVVDSDDLPLNVSREMLQDSSVTRFIHKQVVKKSLEMIEDLADNHPEDYATFWKHYGVVLKEGIHLAPEHKDRIAKLLRFRSSRLNVEADADSAEAWTSLDAYVDRMPTGEGDEGSDEQPSIYYVMGQSLETVASSPHLEALRQRGWEVLFLTDPIDEWVVQALGSYRGKELRSAMRAGLDLEPQSDEEKQEREEQEQAIEGMLKRFRTVLQDRVEEVRTSPRLTSSPACLVVPEHGLHAHVERLIRATDKAIQMPEQKRILEINPSHPLVQKLRSLYDANPDDDQELPRWIELVHDQALLAEGSPIDEPAKLASRIEALMENALGVEGSPASSSEGDEESSGSDDAEGGHASTEA